MNSEFLIALLSLAGTFIGSLAGILTANKLTNYRIEQLEKKVEKHNQVIERVYDLEEKDAVENETLKSIKRRIDNLEEYHK